MNSYRLSCGLCAWPSTDMVRMQEHLYHAHPDAIQHLAATPTGIAVCHDGTVVRHFLTSSGTLLMRTIQTPALGPAPILLHDDDHRWWHEPHAQIWHYRSSHLHHPPSPPQPENAPVQSVKSTDRVCAICAKTALENSARWERLNDPESLHQWNETLFQTIMYWYAVALCDEIENLFNYACQVGVVIATDTVRIIIAHRIGNGQTRVALCSTHPPHTALIMAWSYPRRREWNAYRAAQDIASMEGHMAAALSN